jgi:predicted membrane-bound dolichyl-phosphate-mannose-protein mannosyltransferase
LNYLAVSAAGAVVSAAAAVVSTAAAVVSTVAAVVSAAGVASPPPLQATKVAAMKAIAKNFFIAFVFLFCEIFREFIPFFAKGNPLTMIFFWKPVRVTIFKILY